MFRPFPFIAALTLAAIPLIAIAQTLEAATPKTPAIYFVGPLLVLGFIVALFGFATTKLGEIGERMGFGPAWMITAGLRGLGMYAALGVVGDLGKNHQVEVKEQFKGPDFDPFR